MISKNKLACLCTVDNIQNLICKKWGMLLIIEIYDHKRLRYSDLMHKLDGISPSTLAENLKQLEKNDIIKKHVFDETPRKVEYSLSKKGSELYRVITQLLKWIITNNDHIIHSSFSYCNYRNY